MIYFNPHFVDTALKIIHEGQEMSDVLVDLNRIEVALSDVPDKENLMKACMLDSELRRKYKTIDRMIVIANSFPVASVNLQSVNNDLPEHANLKQDYYGILCEVLIKKQVTSSIEQFIKMVD